MIDLTGEDVPLLFGKWKPVTFKDYPSLSGWSYQYDFEFAHLEISSDSRYSITHYISARGTMLPYHLPEALFEPQILEMYLDGKRWMKSMLEKAARTHPKYGTINVEEYSSFRRASGFSVEVDVNKIPAIKGKNDAVKEVYQSLEDRLRTEFSFDAAEVDPHDILWLPEGDINQRIPGDNGKLLNFGNGTYFLAEFHKNERYSGALDMTVFSDENGERDFHYGVRRLSIDYLKREHASKLKGTQYSDVVHIGLFGDGITWKIDFSKAKFPPPLPTAPMLGYLPGL